VRGNKIVSGAITGAKKDHTFFRRLQISWPLFVVVFLFKYPSCSKILSFRISTQKNPVFGQILVQRKPAFFTYCIYCFLKNAKSICIQIHTGTLPVFIHFGFPEISG